MEHPQAACSVAAMFPKMLAVALGFSFCIYRFIGDADSQLISNQSSQEYFGTVFYLL